MIVHVYFNLTAVTDHKYKFPESSVELNCICILLSILLYDSAFFKTKLLVWIVQTWWLNTLFRVLKSYPETVELQNLRA